MNNADIAAALGEIAELLELKGESSFRVRAYENAGKTLGGLTEDIRVLVDTGRLEAIKGIGKGIAERVEELLDTGQIGSLDKLRGEFPSGVRTLLSVPGVGPKLARRAYVELGVTSLEDLRRAAEDGRLAALPGLGEKSAENVLRGLSRVNKRDTRISIARALPLVEELMTLLRPCEAIGDLMPAGSLRRWAPTIGDIDLMATSSDAEAVMSTFVTLPLVVHVLGHGPTKSAVVTDNGLQVDLRIVEKQYLGSLIQHFTGSKDHNIELREYALARGSSLNEYGITDTATGAMKTFENEESFYESLDLQYIPPELREGRGEIAAARRRELPNLVNMDDIRGELHMHSDWSDGSLPIDEMVRLAADRGYEYVAVTDHSSGAGMAGGASIDRMRAELSRIREVEGNAGGIRVLAGCELEIKRDGSLDFPDEVLEELDWVIASIHSGFNQTEEEMTTRIVRAMENPHVDAIGHPTGRLIGRRQPYAVDLEAIFATAARTNTVLEINSHPDRLDLMDSHARHAIELGALLVINTDAHAPANFDNLHYGVATARRGWAEAGNVLNTRSYDDLMRWLRTDKPQRRP
ncbi:MAG: DNA polymerase/3'-5' exonuclease PolX [Gemmatimonadaceae bacterium]